MEFLEELDAENEAEVESKRNAHHKKVLSQLFGGGFTNVELSEKFITAFKDKMTKCYDGT